MLFQIKLSLHHFLLLFQIQDCHAPKHNKNHKNIIKCTHFHTWGSCMFRVLAFKRDAILLSSERLNFNFSSLHVNSNTFLTYTETDCCVFSVRRSAGHCSWVSQKCHLCAKDGNATEPKMKNPHLIPAFRASNTAHDRPLTVSQLSRGRKEL